MMNNYLLSELGKVKPLCFFTSLNIFLPIHNKSVFTGVKLDTGCAKTCISYKKILFDNEDIESCKDMAISSRLKSEVSFGVNDSSIYKKEQLGLYRSNKYKECTAISFYHNLNGITLGDYFIPVESIKISYDRPSSMLIGMDILEKLDFHCGYSKVLNNYIFIGVLRTQEDKSDYYRALEEHFGILSNSKDVLYQDFLDENTKNEASGFFAWLKNRHKN